MKRTSMLVLVPVVALWAGACTVKKTEENTTEGSKPALEVQPPSIEIQKETTTVVVPKVKIQTPPDTTHR